MYQMMIKAMAAADDKFTLLKHIWAYAMQLDFRPGTGGRGMCTMGVINDRELARAW